MTDIYLAGPWFSDDQSERLDYVHNQLVKAGYDVFFPKDHPASPDSSVDWCKQVFKGNTDHIDEAKTVLAITNGKDMGTIFEAGYAYAKNKPIVYFAEGLNGPFNLMLAQSGVKVIKSREELEDVLKRDDAGTNELDEYLSGKVTADFEGDIQ